MTEMRLYADAPRCPILFDFDKVLNHPTVSIYGGAVDERVCD